MADDPGGKLTLPRNLNLNTVVLLVSVVCSFWAQWAIFKERSDNQAGDIAAINIHLAATDERANTLRDDFIESRAQLRDLIQNLQHQHTQLERSIVPTTGLGIPSSGIVR